MIDFTGQTAIVTGARRGAAIDRFQAPAAIVDEALEVCDRRGISAMAGGAPVSFPEPSAADR